MTRLSLSFAASTLAIGTTLVAGPAAAKSRYVQPYIELGQVVTSDLTNDDTVTYTQVAVGIDAGVETRRTQAQISYRYEHRFDWDDRIGDSDIHTGLARVNTIVTPGLNIEAGAMATRVRSDIRGAAPGNLAGNVANVAQLYSGYVGPTVSTREGPIDIGAAYRFGYTKVEVPTYRETFAQPLDYYYQSTSHMARASAGFAANTIAPFGVTLSGAWERENAGQLDQKYDGWYGRGDVVLPVSPTVALRAGAGYEKIEVTQRDALVDATGNPVTDGRGRFVTDPASPVRIAYNTDGLIYDAGVVWRPSPRLELTANAGWRYGGETYFGGLHWAMASDMAVQVVVYDGIETFGRQLRDGLASLPTSFTTQFDPFGQQFSGCVYGGQPGATGSTGGAGACLNDVFQSVSTASYRARGVSAVWSVTRGRTRMGIGGGYANRKLNVPQRVNGATFIAVEDQSAYLQGFWARDLSRDSAVNASVFGNWYNSGFAGSSDVWGYGANGTYTHRFGRLGTMASLGVYGFDTSVADTQWSAQALLGARYTF